MFYTEPRKFTNNVRPRRSLSLCAVMTSGVKRSLCSLDPPSQTQFWKFLITTRRLWYLGVRGLHLTRNWLILIESFNISSIRTGCSQTLSECVCVKKKKTERKRHEREGESDRVPSWKPASRSEESQVLWTSFHILDYTLRILKCSHCEQIW